MIKTLWTIGHSTWSIEQFIEILQQYDIQRIVDVRSLPGSNKFPQYNANELRASLNAQNIDYTYIKLLGGLRPKAKYSKSIAWRNQSFRNYADYTQTDPFKEGLKELEVLASQKRTAIMCAEVLWWRCHRSIIADYMKNQGWKVINIQSRTVATEHPYTSAASIIGGKLSYEVDKKNPHNQ